MKETYVDPVSGKEVTRETAQILQGMEEKLIILTLQAAELYLKVIQKICYANHK